MINRLMLYSLMGFMFLSQTFVSAEISEKKNGSILVLPEYLNKSISNDVINCVISRIRFIDKNVKIDTNSRYAELSPDGKLLFDDVQLKKSLLKNFSLNIYEVLDDMGDCKYFSYIMISSGKVELLAVKKDPIITTSDIASLEYSPESSRLGVKLKLEGAKRIKSYTEKARKAQDRIFIQINDDLRFSPVVISTLYDVFSLNISVKEANVIMMQYKYPLNINVN